MENNTEVTPDEPDMEQDITEKPDEQTKGSIRLGIESATLHRSTIRGMNRFISFLHTSGISCDLYTVTRADLNMVLKQFYESIYPENAVCRSTMHTLRSAITTSLRAAPYSRDFSLGTDREFMLANQVLKDRVRQNNPVTDGRPRPSTLTVEDVERLAVYLSDWRTGAERLLHSVWFMLCYYFGFKYRVLWARLTVNSFTICTDAQGLEYLVAAEPIPPENARQEGTGIPGERIYGEPVEIFRFFLTKLNPGTERLFSYPRGRYIRSGCWFSKEPVGKNTLGQLMRTISVKAHLTKQYTASSVKGPSVAAIFKARVIDAESKECDMISYKQQTDIHLSKQREVLTVHVADANEPVMPSRVLVPYSQPPLQTHPQESPWQQTDPTGVPEPVDFSFCDSTNQELKSSVQCVKLVSTSTSAPAHHLVRNQRHTGNPVTAQSTNTIRPHLPQHPCVYAIPGNRHSRVDVIRPKQPGRGPPDYRPRPRLIGSVPDLLSPNLPYALPGTQAEALHPQAGVACSSLKPKPERSILPKLQPRGVGGSTQAQMLTPTGVPMFDMTGNIQISNSRIRVPFNPMFIPTRAPTNRLKHDPPPDPMFSPNHPPKTCANATSLTDGVSQTGLLPIEHSGNPEREGDGEASTQCAQGSESRSGHIKMEPEDMVYMVSDHSDGRSVQSPYIDDHVEMIPDHSDRRSKRSPYIDDHVEITQRVRSPYIDVVTIEPQQFPRPAADAADPMAAPHPIPPGTPLDDFPPVPVAPGDESFSMSLAPGRSLEQHVNTLRHNYPWLECSSARGDMDIRTVMYCRPCLDAGITFDMSLWARSTDIQEHAESDRHLAAVGLQTLLGKNASRRPNAGNPSDSESAQPGQGTAYNLEDPGGSSRADPMAGITQPKQEPDLMEPEYNKSPPHSSFLQGLLSPMATEEDAPRLTSDSIDTPQTAQSEEDAVSRGPKEVRVRRFCEAWLKKFTWLYYDRAKSRMYCSLCLRHCKTFKQSNSFIKGNSCFKIVSLSSHAGSLDHQMAEQAERVERQDQPEVAIKVTGTTITARQKFLLKKYLVLFPWLQYRADLESIICELCAKHTRNTLVLNAKDDINLEMLAQHARLHLHMVAVETEVRSWSFAWDGMAKYGLSGDVTVDDPARREDGLRRWSPLFSDRSVAVTGSETELSAVRDGVGTGDRGPADDAGHEVLPGSSENESSVVTPPSPVSAYSHWSSHHRYYVRKKPPLLPAFGVFQTKWLGEFPWLHYDTQLNIMKCRLCEKHKKSLGFARGVKIFSRSYIVGHMSMKKHKEAMLAEGFTVADYPREKKRRRRAEKSFKIKTEPTSAYNSFSDDLDNEDQWTPSLPVSSSVLQYRTVKADSPTTSRPSTHEPPARPDPSHACYDNPAPRADTQTRYIADNPAPRSDAQTDYMSRFDFTQPDSSQDPGSHSDSLTQTPSKKRKRCFYPNWSVQFPWVEYHEDGHYMLCTWCTKQGFKSSFTRGCRTFHIDSLRTHDGSLSHQQASYIEQTRLPNTNNTDKRPYPQQNDSCT